MKGGERESAVMAQKSILKRKAEKLARFRDIFCTVPSIVQEDRDEALSEEEDYPTYLERKAASIDFYMDRKASSKKPISPKVDEPVLTGLAPDDRPYWQIIRENNPTCYGCFWDRPGQNDHMSTGGCLEQLSDEDTPPTCYGCTNDSPGQRDHMASGGCLENK